MPRYQVFTGLGRTLDFSHRSNRVAVAGTVAAFAVLLALSFVDDELTVIGAAAAAVGVFLAWATGRELDPDAPGVATLALAIAAIAAVFNVPSAIVAGVAMLALRLIVGTVGAALSIIDLAVLFGIGAVAGREPILWIVAIALMIWLLSAPEVGRWRVVGLASLLVGLSVGGAYEWIRVWSDAGLETDVTGGAYVLAALAGLTMVLSARPLPVASSSDAGHAVIDRDRLRLGHVAAGSFCMWAAVMGGVAGFWAMGPVFAALTAAAVFRVFVHPA